MNRPDLLQEQVTIQGLLAIIKDLERRVKLLQKAQKSTNAR